MILRLHAPLGQRGCGPLVQGAALVQVRAEKSRGVNGLDRVDQWTGWTGSHAHRRAHTPARTRTCVGTGAPPRAHVVQVHTP